MHDGLSFTKQEAIARHGNRARRTGRLRCADAAQETQVLAFLDSL